MRHAGLAGEREPLACACSRAATGSTHEQDVRGDAEEERGHAGEVVGAGAAGALEEVDDRLVECARGLGDVGPKCRRPDVEMGAGNGAEALFGGEGLVAQLQRELRVSPPPAS